MRLRQVALAVRDLAEAEATLRSVFGLGPPFRDPGVGVFGLANAVFTVGETFLELVTPVRATASAARWLERHGDGGYMVILETRDLPEDRARVLRSGARIVFEAAVEGARTVHVHPRDIGGAILSFDAMAEPGEWRWAGTDWRSRSGDGRVRGLAAVELAGPDPAGLAARWAALLGAPARTAGPDAQAIDLEEGGSLRFVPGPGREAAGISGIALRCGDRERVLAAARELGLPVRGSGVEVLGTRFDLVAHARA